MKKIIYGKPGYGKSYTYLKPLLETAANVVLITPNGTNELKYMNISYDIFESFSIGFGKIIPGKHGIIIEPCYLLTLLRRIGLSDFSKDTNFTVIITNIGIFLSDTDIRAAINIINCWHSNVLLEYTGREEDCIKELDLNSSCWDDWTKISVVNKLY